MIPQVTDNWTMEWDNDHYFIYLVPMEDVPQDEDNLQYPLNYALVYKDTGRVEGMTPTLIGAVTTAHQLSQQIDEFAMLDDIAESAKDFNPPGEGDKEPEVH